MACRTGQRSTRVRRSNRSRRARKTRRRRRSRWLTPRVASLPARRADYEAALRERDERIEALEGDIAEAAETAESADKLRKEMDELRRQGEEQRVGFELQMAGTRNVKAARALLADYDNDVEKLKVGEPWLFGAGTAASEQTGATDLSSAGAATDESAQLRRWRKIASIEGDEE